MLTTIHQIDSNDFIIHVDEEWLVFGRANWISALSAHLVIGKSLWEFISGAETIYLWKILLRTVRDSQKSIHLPYRCDSPPTKRYMSMNVVPLSNGVIEFYNIFLKEEDREPIQLLDPDRPHDERLLVMCSWCKKIRIPDWAQSGKPGEWVDVDSAVRMLRLFNDSPLPRLSHGICGICNNKVMKEIENLA